MEHSQTEGGRRDRPVSDLIRSLLADVALLVRREAELATIELREKGSNLRVAAGLLAAGAALALFAFACLISAAILGLAIILPAWAAALAVAAALSLVAAAFALIGRARLRAAGSLAPTRTLETVQEDIGWIRRETDQLKTAE